VEKCSRAREATDANIMWCMHFACWMTKATDGVVSGGLVISE